MWGVDELIPSEQEMINALKAREGAELQQRFASAAVAVCGLGGLGSSIAVMLARAGVGRLILIDFDRVDVTNLNRQQYKASQVGRYKTDALCENLREIAPYIKLEPYNLHITAYNALRLIKGADVVCEAFDDAEAKAMLTNAVLTSAPDAFLVAASGMAGTGSANALKTRRVSKNFYLCGDGVTEAEDGVCLLPSRVMLCAAHQAHMVLRILAGEFES